MYTIQMVRGRGVQVQSRVKWDRIGVDGTLRNALTNEGREGGGGATGMLSTSVATVVGKITDEPHIYDGVAMLAAKREWYAKVARKIGDPNYN